MKTRKLTQAELRRLLDYDPDTGIFRWKISPHSMARIRIGSIAGNVWHNRGQPHRYIQIHGYRYRAHRLAFFYMRGYWPREIDHKNGDSLDNHWSNLRKCTSSQNSANRGPQKNNKLGVKGVYRTKNGKFRVQVSKDGKNIYRGRFDTLAIAICAYRKAVKKHFGEFAKWN